MATERDQSGRARDDRSGYDYASDDVDRPGLVDDLDRLVDCEVRFDSYTRQLYATDASIYERTPIGVVFPESTADVCRVVEYCAEREIPVLPRGGGTSLAGQTVNEAVVLDFSREMDAVLDVDADARTARAQPGVYLGDLNTATGAHDLKFAPDPAWGDKSALGGAIGNNSTGAHSLRYGKTDAYVREVEVVLADGTVTTFGEVGLDELRERADPEGDLEARIHAAVARIIDEESAAVADAYPDLKRNVSGYNLDWVVGEARRASESASEEAEGATRGVGEPDAAGGTVNLAALLCGSEGTLAVVTEAVVDLEPVPETTGLALLAYDDLAAAMDDVETILGFEPAAVETLDDVLIDLARETAEFGPVVERLPEGTRAVLLVEFYADTDAEGRRQVAQLLADRCSGVDPAGDPGADPTTSDAPVRAFDALEAHDPAAQDQIWKLRKSGLPILLGRTSDEKHVAFVEDLAVPPGRLPAFVERFEAILDDHDTYASFYAHAGPGVLHVRPLVNTKTEAGVAEMRSIAEAATDLVVDLGGSVSGEHGDGRARSAFNEKLYGADVWGLFRELKETFDPDWLLNPGQVVGVDAAAVEAGEAPPRARTVAMDEDLRMGPDHEFDAGFDPELRWEGENGLQGMVELCHGCGGCRGPQDTTGGVMCPTYRASQEEITSTRGRANALRAAMDGDLPDGVDEEFVTEVLDLCVGCKGCAKDCPSEVDMAKLKAEFTHQHHRESGAGLRERLFANVDRLAALGSATAPLSNWATKVPGARWALERTLGVASERSLPTFRRETTHDWFRDRGGPAVPATEATARAVLVVDTYTNYTHPAVGRAAVETLEAVGVHVDLADRTDVGRPAFSKGFLGQARETAAETVAELAPRVDDGWAVVAVEPSDAVMLGSDYRDLRVGEAPDEPARETVAAVADAAYGLCEFLDRERLLADAETDPPAERLLYHGHCHQTAVSRDHHAVGALRRAGYEVDPLDSGCCGMAGSFGYEADHYAMSQAIGEILFEQVRERRGTVVAPGGSCRTQLGDRPDADGEPPHPAEKLAAALTDTVYGSR
jgi:FAD/FMN-containing dehydrogenase/Fe-S oxidoreductase